MHRRTKRTAASPTISVSKWVLRQLGSAKIYVNVNVFLVVLPPPVTMETFLTASWLGPSTTGETPQKSSSNTSTVKAATISAGKNENLKKKPRWHPGTAALVPWLTGKAALGCHLQLISLDRVKSELRRPTAARWAREVGLLQKPDPSSPAEKLAGAALGQSDLSAEFGSACLARTRPTSPATTWPRPPLLH